MARSLRASSDGIKKAKEAFIAKGYTQEHLARVVNSSRQTIAKFFTGKPIEKSIFATISRELDLSMVEIADLGLEETQSSRSIVHLEQEGAPVSTSVSTSVSNLNELNPKEAKVVFVLSGTIGLVDEAKLRAIEAHLREIAGDAKLTVMRIDSEH